MSDKVQTEGSFPTREVMAFTQKQITDVITRAGHRGSSPDAALPASVQALPADCLAHALDVALASIVSHHTRALRYWLWIVAGVQLLWICLAALAYAGGLV